MKRTTGSKMGPRAAGERQGKGTSSSKKGDQNLQGEGNVGKKTRAFRLSGFIFGFDFCFVYLFSVKIRGGGNLGKVREKRGRKEVKRGREKKRKWKRREKKGRRGEQNVKWKRREGSQKNVRGSEKKKKRKREEKKKRGAEGEVEKKGGKPKKT